MLKHYKYKIWANIGAQAGSPENIDFMVSKLAKELKIPKKKLLGYLNILIDDKLNDIPTDIFVQIAYALDVTFEELLRRKRPKVPALYEGSEIGYQIAKKFNIG